MEQNIQALNVKQFVKNMEQVFFDQQPLPKHFLNNSDHHTKELYATMLAGMILADGKIDKNQGLLFRMFLESLGMRDEQAKIFNNVKDLNEEKIKDFCRLANEQNFAICFLADSLILCRIDQELTEAQTLLFNRWCTLLKTPDSHIQTAVVVAANTLGIPHELEIDSSIAVEQFNTWSEFMYIPLTQEALTNNEVKAGYWLINQTLQAHNSWEIHHSALRFTSEGKIMTNQEDAIIRITHCEIELPQFDITAQHFTLSHCTIWGNYAAEKMLTAFTLTILIDGNIDNNTFTTHQARTFKLLESQQSGYRMVQFYDNHFKNCGNDNLEGGCIQNYRKIDVNNSSFKHCRAYLGGGIYSTGALYQIYNCLFEECISIYYQNPNKPKDYIKPNYAISGGGVFIINSNKNNINERYFISKCSFISANVYIRDISSDKSSYYNLIGCHFKNSYLGAYERKTSYIEKETTINNPEGTAFFYLHSQFGFSFPRGDQFALSQYPRPTVWADEVSKEG